MTLLTVEKLYDVSKIHTIRQNNIPIGFEERQRQKEDEMAGGDVLGGPNRLPSRIDVRVDQFPLEVQEEPAVAEVKVGVVPVGVHELVHFRVQDLYERSHVGEMAVHGVAVREVLDHPLHKVAETGVSYALVVEDDEERSHQIAHPLHVADVEVFPDVAEIITKYSLSFPPSEGKVLS